MLHPSRPRTGMPTMAGGFVLAVLLIGDLLAACAVPSTSTSAGGGGGVPEWQFSWSPSGGSVAASTDPRVAFADAGRAEHVGTGGTTEQTPAAVVWLAAGSTFGEVVIQLDPAGRFWNLVTLLIDARSQTWQAYAGDLPTPTACGSGMPFAGGASTFGAHCTLEPVQSGTPPMRTTTIWTTPDSRTFIAARIAAGALPPEGSAVSGVFAGDSGWLLQSNGWTVITVLLSSGETAVFAGTGNSAQCQQLGVDFLKLGADPASLR